MLVRDPVKRYTIKHVRQHRWMTENGAVPDTEDPIYIEPVNDDDAISEQVLQKIDLYGLEREKIIQVKCSLTVTVMPLSRLLANKLLSWLDILQLRLQGPLF